MPTPKEVEEQILARDNWMLAIGMVIAMVIVWLTLNNPSPEAREFSRVCYTICKQVVNDEYKDEEVHWGLRTKYVLSLQACMKECREEADENSDQSLEP
jgi:hypothetical protein